MRACYASCMIEPGYYYHYKHDPAGPVNEYAYEVTGIAKHTEDDSLLVLYRPLYASEYLGEASCFARPLAMFAEEVERDGKRMPRFLRIIDTAVIRELDSMRKMKY